MPGPVDSLVRIPPPNHEIVEDEEKIIVGRVGVEPTTPAMSRLPGAAAAIDQSGVGRWSESPPWYNSFRSLSFLFSLYLISLC